MSKQDENELKIESLSDDDLESVAGGRLAFDDTTNTGTGTCVSNPDCTNTGTGTCGSDMQ